MPSQETLELDFGDPPMPDPESCSYERKRWHGKTLCSFRGREIWTNCREWGKCVWKGWWQLGSSDGLPEPADGEQDDE